MPAQFGSAHPLNHGDLSGQEIIEDRTGVRRKNGLPTKYSKGRFLGKGGFAKCYEVTDMETKEIFAAKIVAKSSIAKPRAHAKLKSEISIHRSLDHDKVVHFYDYFEDSEYVYIILEMCPNQTLNEFMRKRPNKRLAEQETMFYLYELIVALKYLHRRRVIHRDLKLGNLFLDADSRMKVGDFGLAAQLEHDGEKKRTICGTPNYIAPEILEGKHGHSYEVDIWSLGVILYTMLVGRPPFETSDVKTTYRRIRYNQYSFPETVRLSDPAKDLISAILRTDPKSRPSLDEILASPWFQASRMPPSIPVSISGYSASPRPVGASARSETPERGVQDFARIDSPAPRFPLRDRSPSAVAVAQTPTAQVPPQGLPRGQSVGPAVPTKNSSAITPNCGGTTPGRYPAGPGSLSGRPPLAAHRGNEENMAPGANTNASDCLAGGGLCNSNGAGPSPTSSQGFLGGASAQSPLRTPSCSARAASQNHQAPQSYTPHPTTQLSVPRQSSLSHQPPSRERESSPMVGRNNVPTKVVAHGYSSARSATSSPRQPLHTSARANVPNASTPKESSRSARILGQPTGGPMESGSGPLFTKTTPSLLRGTAAQPVPSRRPNTASCDSPRPAMLGTQGPVTPSGWEAESARMSAATPTQSTQDKRAQQLSVQSARKKERSSSSPALLADGEPMTPAGTANIGAHDGSASYRKAPESGIRGLPSCRSSQGINSPAEANLAACLGGEPASSTGAVVAISPTAMPQLWVTKWVDYSSKYGVGYILSDGSIGVYFNDSTKIILCPNGDRFDYITRRTQEKPEARTQHSFEDYPEDLKKKVTLLRHFRNYMLTDILEKKDGASVGESSMPPPAPKGSMTPSMPSQDFDAGQAPYVKKWIRNKHAIMFQLSNKIVQVVFFDKTEAVLSSRSHMVTYIDKKGQVCSYPLSNVLDVPSPELAKRLRYTKDILVNLLGVRSGGAPL